MQTLRWIRGTASQRPVIGRSVGPRCAAGIGLAVGMIFAMGLVNSADAGCGTHRGQWESDRGVQEFRNDPIRLTLRVEYIAGRYSIRFYGPSPHCDGPGCKSRNQVQPTPMSQVIRNAIELIGVAPGGPCVASLESLARDNFLRDIGDALPGFPTRIEHPPRAIDLLV